MSDLQKGYQITSAFRYIQQVFNECQRLLFKIDNHMAPEWSTIYGNRITKDVSASLQEPNRWIIEAVFRVYELNKEQLINKAITISFWGDVVDQPVITAGKIVYRDISKRDHWDLWNVWFHWDDQDEGNLYELNGKINNFKSSECKHIEEAKVFSWPLIDIADEEALVEKIIKPLREL